MTAAGLPSSTGAADRRLVGYVRRTVYPYSAHYRELLDGLGDGRRGDVSVLPPTDLRQISEPGRLVLRPDFGTIVRRGRRPLAAHALADKATGSMRSFNRRLEREFKPVHWVLADGVPIGYSIADLHRLAGLGAEWLDRAGVGREDVLVNLVPSGPSVGYWQLVLGTRRAGVSTIGLAPDADAGLIERLVPSVVAGDASQLAETLTAARDGGHRLVGLHTIVVVGDPLASGVRRQLQSLGHGAAVVGAWGPAGTRAVWSECRAGAEQFEPSGYHAGDGDVFEMASDGAELLWSGVGWRGSVVVRLRTFSTASVQRGTCPACGQAGLRVLPLTPLERSNPSSSGASGKQAYGAPPVDLVDAPPGDASGDGSRPAVDLRSGESDPAPSPPD